MTGRTTRHDIETIRETRRAAGEAFDDAMKAFEPLQYAAAVMQNPARIGEVLIAHLRGRGYDVVKIEGGE